MAASEWMLAPYFEEVSYNVAPAQVVDMAGHDADPPPRATSTNSDASSRDIFPDASDGVDSIPLLVEDGATSGPLLDVAEPAPVGVGRGLGDYASDGVDSIPLYVADDGATWRPMLVVERAALV